jgi:hypothetical protein
MKNKFNLLILTTITVFTSGSILAEELSYDYIDTTIVRYDLESSTSTVNYDGYFLNVSKTLSKNIHLLGGYMDLERDNGNTLGFKSIGFGMNYPINKSTDIVIDYLHYKYEESYAAITTANAAGRINSIEPEIRHQFSDDIELNAGLIWQNFAGRDITFKGLSAGALYRINNDLSFKFSISRAKDSSSTTVDWDGREFGIRYHF